MNETFIDSDLSALTAAVYSIREYDFKSAFKSSLKKLGLESGPIFDTLRQLFLCEESEPRLDLAARETVLVLSKELDEFKNLWTEEAIRRASERERSAAFERAKQLHEKCNRIVNELTKEFYIGELRRVLAKLTDESDKEKTENSSLSNVFSQDIAIKKNEVAEFEALESASDLLNGAYAVLRVIDQDPNFRTSRVRDVRRARTGVMKEASKSLSKTQGGLRVDDLLRLSHANLIKYEAFFHQRDEMMSDNEYLVMEDYSELTSLKTLNKEFSEITSGKIHEVNVLKWTSQIADAIKYLHSKNIVHSDIKPTNIFLSSDKSSVKLGPIKLQSLLGGRNSTVQLRLEDLRYQSPQQIKSASETRESLSAKTDVWSFGCVLYEMINKREAFDGQSHYAVSKAIIENEPPSLNCANYDEIYSRMLQKDEETRIDSETIVKMVQKIKKGILLDGSNIGEYLEMRSSDRESRTNIQLMDSTAFEKLGEISVLDLGNNKLSRVEAFHFGDKSHFNGVRELKLDNNELSFIAPSAFDGWLSLTVLELNNNQIETLDVGLFSGLANLRQLNLSCNKISRLNDGLFDDLASLDLLDLSGNSLTKIDETSFSSLKSLQVLILSGNKIARIESGSFSSLASLMRLQIDNNEITAIDDQLFGQTSRLIELKLNKNSISSLDSRAFANLKNLKDLDLSGNRLMNLDAGQFSSLSSAQRLDLGSNQLTSISHVSFTPMARLLELNLRSNELRELNMTVMPSKLRELNLDDNGLLSIDLADWPGSRGLLKTSISGNEALINDPDLQAAMRAKRMAPAFNHIKKLKRDI